MKHKYKLQRWTSSGQWCDVKTAIFELSEEECAWLTWILHKRYRLVLV